ncbi:hypothetical protein [Streptomyces sp. NPDC047974]|uniref:hypothetical protein n=1 Tax=Streptomyces sp. NPDC047974 TaxID=3154343 RepID=UPI0033F2CCEF
MRARAACAAVALLALALTACTDKTPPPVDTGGVKVGRLTGEEKLYIAALVKAAVDNGITEELTALESLSETELQSEINLLRNRCSFLVTDTSEEEIQDQIDTLEAPEENVRNWIRVKNTAIDAYICP